MAEENLKIAQRELVVVKYGSSSVVDEEGMDEERLGNYAEQLASIHHDYDVIVVSSGAVAVGRAFWEEYKGEEYAGDSEQPLATLGTAEVVSAWRRAFRLYGILVGQSLVTHREIDDPSEGWNLKNVLENSLQMGIVPVMNENDMLSIEELAELAYGGDNDGLASHVARAMGAKALCLLTKKNGLLDESGETVPVVPREASAYLRAKRLAGDRDSRGQGMYTKIRAAMKAARVGIDVNIAGASEDIRRVLARETGTHFVEKPKDM